MGKMNELHEKWSKDPEYVSAYEELRPEFELAHMFIKTRTEAGLTQAQLAERINMTESAVARFESGRIDPPMKTLRKIAEATGMHLKISFEVTR